MTAVTLPTPAAPAPPTAIGRLVLLGHPVAHSLSPRFQNAALAAAGIPLRYEAVDVAPDALDRTLELLVAERAAGNVTLPHKEAVYARCTHLTPLARRVGAVNTFWCSLDGDLWGDNTDVPGVDGAVRALLGAPPTGARVALLGAGGSASAVVAACETWGVRELRLWARTPARAAALAERATVPATLAASASDALRAVDLVINTTPLGLHDADPLPVAIDALPPGATVFDLVYRPDETPWVRAARAAGHPAADGLHMLIEQGARAFARWFGHEPDRSAMWAAVGRAPERA